MLEVENEPPVTSERSALMSRIKPSGSKPEMIVRRVAHALGYRFRLHRRDLPGTPDLVFPSRHKVVFVHGCFWHRHPGCRKTTTPSTRRTFWEMKFARNIERDTEVEAKLRADGWGVLTIWECETKDIVHVAERLRTFLGLTGRDSSIISGASANS